MAIAPVSLGTVATNGSPAFGQATTTGNLLIAWSANGNTGVVCNDTTWFRASDGLAGNGARNDLIWFKPNCASNETAPTFGTGAVALGEFSGADTSSPRDQTGAGSAGASSPITATNSGADAGSGELLVSSGGWTLSKAGTCTTADTYNNGATPSGNLSNDATSTTSHYRFAYGITTGNSSADSDSQSNNSMNLSAGFVRIASFKVAASGPSLTTVTGVGQIATAAVFGVTDMQRVLEPIAVASSGAFGTPKLLTTILKVIGVASSETFGVTRVSRIVARAGSVATAEAFGTPTKSPQVVFEHPGIVSQETFGQTSRLRFLVKPVALASAEAFGRPSLAAAGGTLQTISAAGGIPRPTILVPIAG